MVALSSVVLLGIAAMAIDFGVWFVARSEAQRAAEAGAHAGATILAISPNALDDARDQAEAFAEMNNVREVDADVIPDSDIDIIPDSQKVRVRVQRSQARSNPLSTLFARAMGIDEVNIGATAAAQAWPGSTTECILPFAIPDRWDEWDETLGALRPSQIGDVFDSDEGDVYIPGPGGTGYVAQVVGQQLQLTTATPGVAPKPGWYYSIALPGTSGGSDYREAIRSCWTQSGEHALGDEVDKEPGNMVGPGRQGFHDIFRIDPPETQVWSDARGCPMYAGADLNDANNCLGLGDTGRIRPLVMFDPRVWEDIDQGRRPVQIMNIAGVWLEDWDGNNDVWVRWMRLVVVNPADGWSGAGGSFLKVIRIVE